MLCSNDATTTDELEQLFFILVIYSTVVILFQPPFLYNVCLHVCIPIVVLWLELKNFEISKTISRKFDIQESFLHFLKFYQNMRAVALHKLYGQTL